VNVARVLHRLGANCVAVYLAGGVTGERHHKLMSAEKVRCHVMPIAEETRESFSVHETSSGHDFRFVLPGPNVSAAECEAVYDYVAQHMPKQFLVISGGLPPGVPDNFYARLTALAKQHGVRVVLDTNGPALVEALNVGVYLFKPSLRELQQWTGCDLPDKASQVKVLRQLTHEGKAQVIALSLGHEGAILATGDETWYGESLKVEVKTTIGAGDSFLAGLIWAMHNKLSLQTTFAYGLAAGAAALLRSGTSLCTATDVNALIPQAKPIKIK
jgi:6-phosphofructokinase 2